MYINFEQFPDHARVWIYQANRKLTQEETSLVESQLAAFVEQWAAHGTSLKASFQVFYDRFIVLAVDQHVHAPSGCSIDSSVAVIRSLEEEIGISLLGRDQIAFRNEDEIFTLSLKRLKEAIAGNQLSPETMTFDTTVENLGAFKERWEVPAGQTWLKRFFDRATLETI